MATSKVMETRKRFREIYGGPEDHDYGSMENLANAHREYLRHLEVKRQADLLAQQQARMQQSGIAGMDPLQWIQFMAGHGLPGLVPPNIQAPPQVPPQAAPHPAPYSFLPQPPHLILEAVQFEGASFMRRLFAEFIDFLFFLAIKIFVIGALIEIDLIDLKSLGQALEDDQDMMQFINLAQDLLPIEIVCKIFCCFLEALIMAHGLGPIGRGQTPGKWLAGIRVISCHDVQSGDAPDQVIVEGPNLISWQQSMKRSFMKNVVVNSLFPLSTAAFQIHNGRVFYDLVVKTVVVLEGN